MLSFASSPSHQLISLPHMSFYFTCPKFPSQTHPLGRASWKTGNGKQIAARASSGDGSAMWRGTHIRVPFRLHEKGCCDGVRTGRGHTSAKYLLPFCQFVRGHSSTSKAPWAYSVTSLNLLYVNCLPGCWTVSQLLGSRNSLFTLNSHIQHWAGT